VLAIILLRGHRTYAEPMLMFHDFFWRVVIKAVYLGALRTQCSQVS
jgi:hypothetical protein